MPRLKPHHYDLLRKIISAKELALADVDGRVIRPLKAAGLVQIKDGRASSTQAGRDTVAASSTARTATAISGKMSVAQEDLLRLILRQPGIASEDVDMRTLRALRSRGLVYEIDGQVSTTPAAGAALQRQHPGSAEPRRGRPPRRDPRAEAILKATEQLEQALPRGAEILVGSIMCAAEDVTAAFRKHARMLIDRRKKRD